jgi:hypothetical protein
MATMATTSTAKQRLWLTCLGYQVPSNADSENVRSIFDHASTSGRYQQPPNALQRELAREIGVDISGEQKCNDAAGKIYHVFLLRAWTYSVWRSLSESAATSHEQTGLPEASATAIARGMNDAGLFDEVDKFATTDSRNGDVWYRMSKAAQSSAAFRYAAERLAEPTAREQTANWEQITQSQPSSRGRRATAVANQGKGCLLFLGIAGFAIATCFLSR